MKQILRRFAVGCITVASVLAANAARPKIMVLPDKAWAVAKGYGTNQTVQGRSRFVVDYDKCFIDPEFLNASKVIDQIMQGYGFPLVNQQSQAEADDFEDAVDEAMTDDEATGGVRTNTLDDLLNKAKPDIILYFGWDKHSLGFDYTASLRMDAVDSYSNKSIATETAESQAVPSSTAIAALIKAVTAGKMPAFTEKLDQAFTDMQTQGREMSVRVTTGNDAAMNMESLIGDETLATVIYNWLNDNTVNHQFSERSSSPNRLVYDQVRVALRDEKGRPQQARQFVDRLIKHLASKGVKAVNRTSGLGTGRIIIN